MTSARCYNQYCSPHDSTYVVTSWSESTGLVLLMCQILVSALLLAAASKWKVLVHLLIPPEPHRSPNECNITFSTRPHCVVFRPDRLVLNAPSSLASRVGGEKCSTSRRLMTSPQPPACQPTARLSRDRCACAVTFNTRASWMFLFYSLVSCEQQNFRKMFIEILHLHTVRMLWYVGHGIYLQYDTSQIYCTCICFLKQL